MIIERKEFHCKLCGGIKLLNKDDKEPDCCPFCGIDSFGKIHWGKVWCKSE